MGALPDFKDIIDLMKKGSTLEAQEKIMQLREEHLNLREEVLTLREESRLLRERRDLADKLAFEPPYYWLERDGRKDGPFCQVCWDRDGKLIRLQKGLGSGSWRCEGCKTHFRDGSYSPPPVQQVSNRRPQRI